MGGKTLGRRSHRVVPCSEVCPAARGGSAPHGLVGAAAAGTGSCLPRAAPPPPRFFPSPINPRVGQSTGITHEHHCGGLTHRCRPRRRLEPSGGGGVSLEELLAFPPPQISAVSWPWRGWGGGVCVCVERGSRCHGGVTVNEDDADAGLVMPQRCPTARGGHRCLQPLPPPRAAPMAGGGLSTGAGNWVQNASPGFCAPRLVSRTPRGGRGGTGASLGWGSAAPWWGQNPQEGAVLIPLPRLPGVNVSPSVFPGGHSCCRSPGVFTRC